MPGFTGVHYMIFASGIVHKALVVTMISLIPLLSLLT